MLETSKLKDILHTPNFSVIDRLLICLAAIGKPSSIGEIKSVAISAGYRAVQKANVSACLSKSGGKAVRTDNGWEFTTQGKKYVSQLMPSEPAAQEAKSLRALLPKIADQKTANFLEEAIACAESSHFRAAVVLSWVGAVSVLYNEIISSHLAAFNAECLKRDPKWKIAKTTDDLTRLKEFDFLQILEAISVIGKNTKQELEGCLKLRNACGHPSSLKIGSNKVAAHIETLAQNVFGAFV